ncbi:MAG: aldo/keto reductase [Alphaproteobacteria bacterium]|tara:strand:- start:830 stop:1870 length:1041 start_codon:yes stop_codon:yes gene_type:complete
MIKKRKIGLTNLEISELGMGTAPLGGWPVAVDPEEAQLTIAKAWESGIRYFDTAPLYGSGMAEERIGKFLKEKKREDFCIATKVGRLVVDTEEANEKFKGQDPHKDTIFDFSYDAVMRSFEESLKRLQLDSVDILHLHDPDNHPDHLDHAKKGAIKAMLKLRDEKAVKALGCGMNQNEMLLELAKMGHFDCFLLAGRYSLLDQTSLEELIPYCKENHISLILGGVFNSGILINPSPESYFDYSKLDENWAKNLSDSLVRIPKDFESADYWLNKAYKLRDFCSDSNISLRRAAIQFPYLNDVVASVVLGMTSVSQVEENFEDFNNKISPEFWTKLKDKELIHPNAPI